MQVSFKNKKPTLYLVATPIGNLEDITFRAIETLKNVSVCFAEDTRTSKILFDKYNINTKMISYHDHDKITKIDEVLKYLNLGLDVALISDAGTPLISDPGYELVNEVINNNYYVVSIPGPAASITGLVASGLISQPHLFIGFLPRKESEIKNIIEKYKNISATLIIYESPFRINKTLNYLYEVLGNRKVVLARELTKIYETYLRTDLLEAVKIEHNKKGEYVIYVEGFNENINIEEVDIFTLYNDLMKQNNNEKEVLSIIAKKLNIPKREVYHKIKIEGK